MKFWGAALGCQRSVAGGVVMVRELGDICLTMGLLAYFQVGALLASAEGTSRTSRDSALGENMLARMKWKILIVLV